MVIAISFKDYIELLPPHCIYSAIFSSDGTIWAVSDGWTFTSADGKMVANLMEDPIAAMKAKLTLGQRTYLIAYADMSSLVARKREFGIMVARCKVYYVLGYCDGTVDPGKCNQSVHRVAEMMKKTSRQART
jgi:methionine salvage enolase-phosphatase E1